MSSVTPTFYYRIVISTIRCRLFFAATPTKRASHAFIEISRDSSEINTQGNIIIAGVVLKAGHKEQIIFTNTLLFCWFLYCNLSSYISLPVCIFCCGTCNTAYWNWNTCNEYYFVLSLETMLAWLSLSAGCISLADLKLAGFWWEITR